MFCQNLCTLPNLLKPSSLEQWSKLETRRVRVRVRVRVLAGRICTLGLEIQIPIPIHGPAVQRVMAELQQQVHIKTQPQSIQQIIYYWLRTRKVHFSCAWLPLTVHSSFDHWWGPKSSLKHEVKHENDTS